MKTLPIDQVNPTPAELARVGQCRATHARYAELIQKGIELPPITVFHDGEVYWLADGRHRLAARKSLGYADIQVEVKPGTERDAQLNAFKANQSHGLPARQEDRKKIARILLADDEWKGWSDRKIADFSGLSHPTVGKMRAALVKITTPSQPSQTVSVIAKMKTVSTSSGRDAKPESEPEGQADSYDPSEDQLKDLVDLVAEVTADNERLKEQIALGVLDIPEEEKIDLASNLRELRVNLERAEMENKTLATSRNTYMNRAAEAIEKVKRLQYVLKRKDEEIGILKQDLYQERKRVESLEAELAFEQATR